MASGARFEHNEIVTLRLAGAGELPARVERDDGESFWAVLVLPAAGAWRIEDEARMTVEWTTRRGLHRMSVTASPDLSRPELLELRREDSARVFQRRDGVRVDAVVDAEVTIVDSEKPPFQTNTLDISLSGVCLRDPENMSQNNVIDITLTISEEEPPLGVRGVVVREPRPGQKGVRFEPLSAGDQHRLMRFITERQRLELRVRRERLGR